MIKVDLMKSLCLGKWGILSVISLVSTLTRFENKHVYLQGHVYFLFGQSKTQTVQVVTRSKIKWVFPKFEISVKNLRYSLRLPQFLLKFTILDDRDITFAEIASSLRITRKIVLSKTKNSRAQIVLKYSFFKITWVAKFCVQSWS